MPLAGATYGLSAVYTHVVHDEYDLDALLGICQDFYPFSTLHTATD